MSSSSSKQQATSNERAIRRRAGQADRQGIPPIFPLASHERRCRSSACELTCTPTS